MSSTVKKTIYVPFTLKYVSHKLLSSRQFFLFYPLNFKCAENTLSGSELFHRKTKFFPMRMARTIFRQRLMKQIKNACFLIIISYTVYPEIKLY